MKTKTIIITLIGLLAITALVFQACKKDNTDDPENPTAPVYTNGVGEIGPLGGIVTVEDQSSPLNGISVHIPEGALLSTEMIIIEKAPDSIKFLGDSTVLIIKLTPDGLLFKEPITISFPILNSHIEEKLVGYYYDPVQDHVAQLPTVIDEENNLAEFTSTHFSYFYIEDGMWANVDMYYVNNKPSVKLWIDGDYYNYGFDGIPTTFYLTLQGLYSAKKVVDDGVFLLDDGVISYFNVKLKKKVSYWFDPTIEEKKVFIRRIGSQGSFGADVLENTLSSQATYSDETMTSDEREPFFHGKAIFVHFETQLENDKEYYIVADWRLIDTYPIIWGLSFPYTSNYEVNNYDYALKPAEMDHGNDDLNGNAVDDWYESAQNTPPIASFTVNPTSGNTSTIFNFDASGCHDNEDPVSSLEVRWDWENDGNWDVPYSTNKIIANQYTQAGSYTIKLEVKDTEGLTNTETNQIIVNPVGVELPTVITHQASNITQNSASSGGNITDEGSSSVSVRGVCWNTTGTPTIVNTHTSNGNGLGAFISNISDLYENTLYYVRAYATNNEGIAYGEEISFTTSNGGNAPLADFLANITSGTAPFTVTFTDLSTHNPTSWEWDFGDGGTSNDQTPSHTYNEIGSYAVTLIASNEYGADTETKINYIVAIIGGGIGTITDQRDGQTYNTVNIGSQTWFAENLNYEAENSWCYFDQPGNCDTYGRLYTWGAAKSACPAGWHLPSDDEWIMLEMYLGMSQSQAYSNSWRGTNEGKRLKTTNGWDGLDDVGFSALPGGYRIYSGYWYHKGSKGYWWSKTGENSADSFYRKMESGEDRILRTYFNINCGMSVRCVKD